MAYSNDEGGGRTGRPGSGRPDARRGGDRPFRPAGGPRREGSAARRDREEAPADDASRAPQPPAEDRIAKVVARAGIASRRDVEAMIAEGRVTLNGVLLTSPAVNVGPDDRITVDGEPLPSRERPRLWLFHKPRGLVTTFRDPEGRPTVFDALPDDLPRVVAIGRLDINTEGLLLLTNDGGLAKVIAHPETGWARRYRVRVHGEVIQAELDKLSRGVTVDGMEYGPITATLDRQQGDNSWLTLTLREGKNREVKRVLEHLGIQVNRLIRLSFGPFQLGELEQGLVEEVRTRVLKDQLGDSLAEQAGVDFESPARKPIAPFGKPAREEARPRSGPGDRPARAPRPRSAQPAEGRFGDRGGRDEVRTRAASREPAGRSVWREGEDAGPKSRRPGSRREDPKADRDASARREHRRVGAIESPGGRKVLVERVVADRSEERPARPPRARVPRTDEAGERGPRPERAPRAGARPSFGGKLAFGGKPGFGSKPGFRDKPGRGAASERPDRPGKPFGAGRPERPGKPFGAGRTGGPGKSFGGGRPDRPGKSFGAGRPGGGDRPGGPPSRGRPGGPRRPGP